MFTLNSPNVADHPLPGGPPRKGLRQCLPDRRYARSGLVLALWALVLWAALANAQQLPRPLNLGSQGGPLLPAARSDDLAFHVRGQVLVDDLPSGNPSLTAQLGLSVSLFRWAEAGAAWCAAPRNDPGLSLRPGPVTTWARLSPPVFERAGVAAQIEYAAAVAPIDGGGTLFPDTETISLLADYEVGRLRLSGQAAAQLADNGRYRGVQGGAGLWFVLVHSLRFAVGIEVMGRTGQRNEVEGVGGQAGWQAALGIGSLDQTGFRGAVGYALGGGNLPSSTLILQMGTSYGVPYRRPAPPAARDLPVPAWLMALYSRWFPSAFIDPILLPSGMLIDDDGTPLYQAADPDPVHPGQLRMRQSGQTFPAGTHFYRAGRLLLSENGQMVETMPALALARLSARRLQLDAGVALERALAAAHRQAQDLTAAAHTGWTLGMRPVLGAMVAPVQALGRTLSDPATLQALAEAGELAQTAHQLAHGGLVVMGGVRVRGSATRTRPVPNPYGSKGKPDHQAAVGRLRKQAESEFQGPHYVTHENETIRRMPGEVNRRPDVWVENTAKDRVEKVYEAVRTNKDGTPVAREQKKVQEYHKAGIPVHVEPVK